MLSGSELSLVQITAFCTGWKISLYCFTSKSAKLRLLRSRRVPKQINHEIPNREFGHLYFCFVLYAEQYPGHHYFLSDLIKKKDFVQISIRISGNCSVIQVSLFQCHSTLLKATLLSNNSRLYTTLYCLPIH
jgi:hypothetical protein